ncbi:MAG: guanylate kinase [Syntrophobacteraceae bacterium]
MYSPVNTGQLFIISAPSGVGKTTLIRAVLPQWPELRFSISNTTRLPRSGEVSGKDYHFITKQEFIEGIQAGRFLEWAEVHGEYYGTDGNQIAEWLAAGKDILLDIDVQGALQVRCAHPRAHTIFILPPSLDALLKRLKSRGTESEDQLARRFEAARREMQEAAWYDFMIINDVLEDAVADLDAILRACRCERTMRAHRLRSMLSALHPE